MEWKGYWENFDKDAMVDKKTLGKARKIHKAEEIFADRKKKVMMNLIEFVVWAWLLIFCFSYLQSHPAEKSSLFSGTEAIVQKIKVTISQRTKWHWWQLAGKYQLERTYEEIMNTAIMWKCLSDEEIKKIQRALDKLKNLNIDEFLQQERAYQTVADIYYKKVKSQCTERK